MKIEHPSFMLETRGRRVVLVVGGTEYQVELSDHQVGELFMEMFRVAPVTTKADVAPCCGTGCCG